MPCPDVGTRTIKPCRCICRWRCQCLCFRTRKPGPPFGASSKRDAKVGLHPNLIFHASEAAPVGTYNPLPIKSKCPVPSWDKEMKLKEFAETMGGHLLEKYVVQRNLMRVGRGPGTHDIIRWPQKICCRREEDVKKDAGFGFSSRFRRELKSTTPGPGYTPKTHNPYYHLEQKRFQSLSKTPTFEFDGLAPRFPEKKSFSLPCNLYNVKDPNSLDSVLKKVISKRGPYDLFTGPRDESTLYGYLARSKPIDSKSWPFLLPGEIDKLLHPSNYFKGRWTNCPRFLRKPVLRILINEIATCYKDPDAPGPGQYDPISPRKPQNAKQFPFDSSVEFARPLVAEKLQPGPGRYKIDAKRRIKGNGWTYVFKSKVPRTIAAFLPETYNSF